jgi:hypothetical protein
MIRVSPCPINLRSEHPVLQNTLTTHLQRISKMRLETSLKSFCDVLEKRNRPKNTGFLDGNDEGLLLMVSEDGGGEKGG